MSRHASRPRLLVALEALAAFLTPYRRRRMYAVTAAGLSVAGVYGLVDGEQAAALLVLAGAVCGQAAVFTPTPAAPS